MVKESLQKSNIYVLGAFSYRKCAGYCSASRSSHLDLKILEIVRRSFGTKENICKCHPVKNTLVTYAPSIFRPPQKETRQPFYHPPTTHSIVYTADMNMGWVHAWVGLGWVGHFHVYGLLGWIDHRSYFIDYSSVIGFRNCNVLRWVWSGQVTLLLSRVGLDWVRIMMGCVGL